MSDTPQAHLALVGGGNISRRYLQGLSRFPGLRVAAVADVVPERARALAAEAGPDVAAGTLDDVLALADVDLVVNITPPTVHASVTERALRAGKDVYVEKPLADTTSVARGNVALARSCDRLLGAAPDTFLGSAAQTARRALDDGLLGEVIGAVAFVTHSRAETWHPDPTFLFRPGGGPALDLGPYYVTSLVNLLGPVARVSGSTRIGATPRRVTAPDRLVDSIDVQVPTHGSATLEFAGGAIGTLVTSFDVWGHHLPYLEVYGSRGTLTLPDPNGFDGDVLFQAHEDEHPRVLDPVLPVSAEPGTGQLLRGMGVADLAAARSGAPHRATGDLALHVLEVLESVQVSSDSRTVVELASTTDRPAPVTPLGVPA